MPMDYLYSFTTSYFVIISTLVLSFAADTITPGRPIRDGETLVSSSQSFELGFFSRNSKERYLGIWYKFSPMTVVWVANRYNPINDPSGLLAIGKDGNLFLLNQTRNIFWSSNTSKVPKNPVARLLDSGNLVIVNNNSVSSDVFMWQSFDYPSDTMLPGMKLGGNTRTGLQWYLTSWRRNDDPSPGGFTYKLDVLGLPELVIRRGSVKTSRTGPWNGITFGGIPMVSNMVFKPYMIFYGDELYYMYKPFSDNIVMRLTLNQSGVLQRFVWNENTTEWAALYSMPYAQCDNYAKCGANGICSVSAEPICNCLEGFVPKSPAEWGALNWTGGCVRKSPFSCRKGEEFVNVEGVRLPDLVGFQVNKSMDQTECKIACSHNCSCTAYANSSASGAGSGCLMWFGDLLDIRLVAEEYRGQDIYIRLPSSDKESKRRTEGKTFLAVSITMGMLLFSLVLCCLVWKVRAKRRGHQSTNKDIKLPLFDLATIAVATNNFAEANIVGEGGFGPVYKGKLFTGEEIAVKRLSKNSGQGVEQFMNEVELIAKLQHRNLVALLGCCIQREERILIYEYMPNKSLDYFIFDHQRCSLLTWKDRLDIVLGISRGLLYLHHDSKLRVIHRDLKVSNILLDNDLKPKISDFGLARILGGDDKEATTKRIIGTYGYMSPEYAIDGTISLQSDVFSFGVLLLEIVSGKKNRGLCHMEQNHNLLGHAWLLWSEDRVMELTDKCLKDSFVKPQVLRCIQVGLLCVQNFPEDRPTMASVVFMLANEEAVLPQPKQPGFFREPCSNINTTATPVTEESYTGTAASITTLDGR